MSGCRRLISTERLDATRTIRRQSPPRDPVLSAQVEVDQAMELLAAGEQIRYALKSRVVDVDDFIQTIDRVAGRLSSTRASSRSRRGASTERPARCPHAASEKCWARMAEGYPNSGIARRLFVTEGTVEKHVNSILRKLQLPESPMITGSWRSSRI